MNTATHARETNMNQGANLQLRKSPALAGFLSIMPGAGQVYVGYYIAGFTNILIIGSLITILDSGVVHRVEPFFGMFLAFFWIFNVVDAVRRARLYNLRANGVAEESIPTDSPLVGGVILAFLGLILTLTITFDVRLDWLENVWPLAILGAGIYLIVRYRTAKDELERRAMSESARSEMSHRASVPPPPAFPPPGPRADFPAAVMTSSGDEGEYDSDEKKGPSEPGMSDPR